MAWAQETNIRGPQGVKGDTGDTGPQGIQGPAGPAGGSAGGENLGTGQDVYKGLNGVSGALQFNRVRGTGIVTASSDANGVIVNAPTPDWAVITNKPATFPPTLPIASSGVTGLDAAQSAQDTAIGTKLNSSAYTAADVLAKMLTVDGAGSTLDADLLDGQTGTYYQNATNLTFGTLPAARFDDTAHGARAGGTLHANVVAAGAAGFMTGSDKTKLDGVAAGATNVPPATVTPLMDGVAAVGATTKYAREDHVHPTDTSRAASTHTHAESDVTNLVNDLALKAPLASPTFTGTPAAPTATAGTNTTQIASTAFVTAAVAAGGGGGASVTISDTAPGSPTAGDMWWESDSGALFVYFTDATPTSQWVQVASATSAAGGLGTAAYKNLHVGTTAPSSPAVNDVWIDTT